MSKKKAVVAGFFIMCVLIINIAILACYQVPIKDQEIMDLQVTLTSGEAQEMQVFYVLGADATADGFAEDKVSTAAYENANEVQTLTFQVPVQSQYMRLDLGMEGSESIITDIQLSYKNQKTQITIELLSGVEDQNDVSKIELQDGLGLVVLTETGDPFLVWNVENWNLRQLADEANQVRDWLIRIGFCLGIDIVFIGLLYASKRMSSLIMELIHNRSLLWSLAKNDFKTRFAGSYLGIIWAFIQPIVTVLVYWFVFEKGLKSEGVNNSTGAAVPFVLWLIAGLVPWFFFSDALNGATNALLEYAYLVKKVVFKISILPIVKMVSALFVHLFFIAFILVLYACYRYYPDLYTLQVFYYSFAMFLLVLGLAYATCSIVIFFRDLTQVINVVLQVGVWVTPIMWDISRFDSPVLLFVLKLNPMYYIVIGYRDALINKVWFFDHPLESVYFWVLTAGLFVLGTIIFKRLKVHFADVL